MQISYGMVCNAHVRRRYRLGGGGGFSDKSSNIQLSPPLNIILLKYPANSY